uniref:SMAX1-like AAA+ ATPase lid domain-containing protein n=1 Tax=Glycine max TaxID=3847 RepID=A0A0R0GJR3_SOYBN
MAADLGLGMCSSPTSNQSKKPSTQYTMEPPKEISSSFSSKFNKVSWQDEASSVISRTIAGCHAKRVGANQRGDVWMNFVGPDRNGKKKVSVSLVKFLGKTTLDFIVGEFCKKRFSVVFLENVDKADVLVQNSLSQAIKTRKLIHSHREVGVNNAIFVTSFSGHQAKDPYNYSEERIAKVKVTPIKIAVEHVSGDIRSQRVSVADGSIERISNLVLVNEHLNLPAEDTEMEDGNLEHASTENQNLWLQDLYDQVDETVVFKPFNFDELADRVVKVMTSSFHKTIGSECALQIVSEVMDQLLAAAYVSDRGKDNENWVEEVLCGGFTEVQRRHNLTASSIVKLFTCSHQASSEYLLPSITME